MQVMYEPDSQLRDFENVRLIDESGETNIQEIVRYFQDEVKPHVNDAWADKEKICKIDKDIKQMEEEIIRLLREVTE